ncbi:MAG: IS5 family transposase [Gammaproteobacteria bacterium]
MYATDLSDEQWQLLIPLLKIQYDAQKGGRPRTYPLRNIVDGILYITKTGCQWRLLPSDFAPWQSVYGYFRTWKKQGIWDQALMQFRKAYRVQSGRAAEPTAAIIDAQSTKTTGSGKQRGYDAGKKTKGRKRHIAVDTMGNLLAVCVHSAGIQDRRGARLLMIRLYALFATLSVIWADGGYSGVLVEWAKQMFNWQLTIVKRTDAMQGKFMVLPRRWVVERSFAWLGNSRRLSKDYERLTDTAEVFIKIAEVHRLLRRIS